MPDQPPPPRRFRQPPLSDGHGFHSDRARRFRRRSGRYHPFTFRPLRPFRNAAARSPFGPRPVFEIDPLERVAALADEMFDLIDSWAEAMAWHVHELHESLGTQDDDQVREELLNWNLIYLRMRDLYARLYHPLMARIFEQ